MSKDKEVHINPDFTDIYCWELVPTEKEIKLMIKTDNGFDPKLIEFNLNEDKDSVSIRYPEQPPLVEGRLFSKINDLTMKIEGKNVIFTFAFDPLEQAPPIFIVDFHKETGKIDPLSSFILFSQLQNSQDERSQASCFSFLQVGVDYFFVPSMIAAATIFQRIDGLQEKALELICIAADRYKSHEAELHMGLFFINNPVQKDKAIYYLERAIADPDLPIAKFLLGLLLSPISEMESPKKDAAKAVQYLEEGLRVQRHPLGLHELAMLLYNGIGVEKDVERAERLNKESAELDNGQTPPLTERDETYVPKKPEPSSCGCKHCHCHH